MGGTGLVALRVWFHFTINAIATLLALHAAQTTWRTQFDGPEVAQPEVAEPEFVWPDFVPEFS